MIEGPWDQAFVVVSDLKIASKSNFRRGDDWRRQKRFEADIRALIAAAVPEGWDVGSPKRAVSERPDVVVAIYAHSRLDAVNLSKSLCDACEAQFPNDIARGDLYLNDASIRMCIESSSRVAGSPATTVGFARLAPGSSAKAHLVAATALMGHVLEAHDSAATASV